jgi:hypothetical protein
MSIASGRARQTHQPTFAELYSPKLIAAVPFLDSTAANAMNRVAAKSRRQGIRLFIVADGAPGAPHPWGKATKRHLPRNDRAGRCGYQRRSPDGACRAG